MCCEIYHFCVSLLVFQSTHRQIQRVDCSTLIVLLLTRVFVCVQVSLPLGSMGWSAIEILAYCNNTSSVLVFGSSFVV